MNNRVLIKIDHARQTMMRTELDIIVDDVDETVQALVNLRSYMLAQGSKPVSHRPHISTHKPSMLLQSSLHKPGEIDFVHPAPFSSVSACRRDHNKAVGGVLHQSSVYISVAPRERQSFCSPLGDDFLVERRILHVLGQCHANQRKRPESSY